MIWWQWLLTIGVPALAVGLGLLLGKLVSLKYFENPSKPLFKSRRTYAARQGWKTITFDKFLELYQINPKKWSWRDGLYHYWESKRPSVFYIFDKDPDAIFPDRTEIYWETERDKRRFNKWIKEMDNRKLHEQETADYKRVLEDVQKDVQAKMDAIQKEREAELKRIEEERKQKRTEYNRLQEKLSSFSQSTSPVYPIRQLDPSLPHYGEINKVYMKKDVIDLIKQNTNLVKIWDGSIGYFFEADCGTPYIHTVDGRILEVEIEK